MLTHRKIDRRMLWACLLFGAWQAAVQFGVPLACRALSDDPVTFFWALLASLAGALGAAPPFFRYTARLHRARDLLIERARRDAYRFARQLEGEECVL